MEKKILLVMSGTLAIIFWICAGNPWNIATTLCAAVFSFNTVAFVVRKMKSHQINYFIGYILISLMVLILLAITVHVFTQNK